MLKNIFLIIFIINSFIIQSQKEIYFNTSNITDIKVKSYRGFEARISLYPDGFGVTPGTITLPGYYEPALYIGYFSEKKIADCWTLNTKIGLQNIASRRFIWVKDSITGNISSNSYNYNTGYDLKLEAEIEPRWYLDFKHRYQLNIAYLNSGIFLSFPFSIQTTILHSPEPIVNLGWFPNWFYGYASIIPTLGYRQSISKNWFLEGSFGLGTNFIFSINSWTHNFEITKPSLMPQLRINAAYTFNK